MFGKTEKTGVRKQVKKDAEKKRILEKERKEKILKNKGKLTECERKLKEVEVELKNKCKMKDDLFVLGSKRLKKACDAKNMEEIKTAQHILNSIETVEPEEKKLLKESEELEVEINKIRDNLLKNAVPY